MSSVEGTSRVMYISGSAIIASSFTYQYFLRARYIIYKGVNAFFHGAKRSRKSSLSIPFILRDRRFLSPLITEHPTPAHIFLTRSPACNISRICPQLARRGDVTPRSPSPTTSTPLRLASTLPLRLFFPSRNGRNERKKASTWHNQSDPKRSVISDRPVAPSQL